MRHCPPRGRFSRFTGRFCGSADPVGIDVHAAAISRDGHLRFPAITPAQAVCVHILAVDLQGGGVGHCRSSLFWSPMATISSRRAVGHPVQHHRVPDALDAGARSTRWPWMVIASAPPDHSALTTAWMSCWWTTSNSRTDPGRLQPGRGVVQYHRHRWAPTEVWPAIAAAAAWSGRIRRPRRPWPAHPPQCGARTPARRVAGCAGIRTGSGRPGRCCGWASNRRRPR